MSSGRFPRSRAQSRGFPPPLRMPSSNWRGFANGGVLRVDGGAQRACGFVGGAQVVAHRHRVARISSSSVRSPIAIDCSSSSRRACVCRRSVRTRGNPLLELQRGFAQPQHIAWRAPRRARSSPACARARRSGPVVQFDGRFLRRQQIPLRIGQPLVGYALILLEAADCLLRAQRCAHRARHAPPRPAAARGQ